LRKFQNDQIHLGKLALPYHPLMAVTTFY